MTTYLTRGGIARRTGLPYSRVQRMLVEGLLPPATRVTPARTLLYAWPDVASALDRAGVAVLANPPRVMEFKAKR